MVGVPVKSTACLTCLRRKRGCDKQTPFCQKCTSSGLVCQGYKQPSIWVNTTGKQRATYTRAHNSVRAPAEPDSVFLYESLVRTARNAKYVGLFLSAYLLHGRIPSAAAIKLSPVGWVRHHEYLSRTERSLQLITLAHSLSMLASLDDNEQLGAKGIEAYQAGLRETAHAIQDPQRAEEDGLLAAVRLYRFYEIRYGAGKVATSLSEPSQQVNNYRAHTEGELALFKAKGPKGPWTGPARNLLADGRIVSYIRCIEQRKRSFFCDPDWMTLPWTHSNKTTTEHLLDILVQTTGTLEDLDQLRERNDSSMQDHEARSRLLSDCLEIEQSLMQWKRTMGESFHRIDNAMSQLQDTPLIETDEDASVLQMALLYWSASIILYTTLHVAGLQPSLPAYLSHPDAHVPFACPGHAKFEHPRNPTWYAHKILHAAPQCHQTECGSYVVLGSIFPLGLAVRYLRAAPFFPHAEGQRLTRIIESAFLEDLMAQAFWRSYAARFLDNIEQVYLPDSTTKSGHGRAECKARRWWLGRGQGGIDAKLECAQKYA